MAAIPEFPSKSKKKTEKWKSLPSTTLQCPVSSQQFLEVVEVLILRPNLNSTHLFRADILYDSSETLETICEKNHRYESQLRNSASIQSTFDGEASCILSHLSQAPSSAPDSQIANFPAVGLELQRTIVRKLIPRKPQVDNPLEQSCYVHQTSSNLLGQPRQICVIYIPHVTTPDDIPWYHPAVKALAYLYTEDGSSYAELSMHFLQFQSTEEVSERLERTLLSMAKTTVRLMKMPSRSEDIPTLVDNPPNPIPPGEHIMKASLLRDTIIPQHIVQDTYTRLKQQYASDLISRWVEKTEPSKHVFEDLSIAAFLIELWRMMYDTADFPGFIDIACGNGVLVYILIKEGYHGRGFDARRRRTWEILGMDDYIQECTCIPKPYLDIIGHKEIDSLADVSIHNGLFNPGTFIISNHADELTPWTPILSALSCPDSPLPFLAIPCCSHALDGSKHRYNLKEVQSSRTTADPSPLPRHIGYQTTKTETDEQPASGNLKALRTAKAKAASHEDDKSMYSCLTKKTAALASELGIETELTLMRIPSTRNIGIVGNRKRTVLTVNHEAANGKAKPAAASEDLQKLSTSTASKSLIMRIQSLIERECSLTGGLEQSAWTWIEGVNKLHKGQGRGKVNLRREMKEKSDVDECN